MKPHKQLVKSVQQDIRTLEKSIERIDALKKIINITEQAFTQGYWDKTWFDDIEFTLPFSTQLIEEVREFIAVQFPHLEIYDERQHVWDEDGSAGHFIEYRIEERHKSGVKFAFRSEKEGSTCVLNQIGEKTVPVFEVVCSQEAVEEFGVAK